MILLPESLRRQRGYINPAILSAIGGRRRSGATSGGGGGGGSGDPHFASVVLLALNESGADGTTTFIDQSNSGHTLSALNNAQWDTAQAPTGLTSSALFDGNADTIQVPDSDDFNLANGSFTIEFYIRWNSKTNFQQLVTQWGDAGANGCFSVGFNASQQLCFNYSTSGAGENVVNSGWSPSLNTWYHIEVVRDGASLYIFVDGVQQGSTFNISTTTLFNSTRNLDIGNYKGGSTIGHNGWIAALRITKGVARHTTNFTPPSLPLPTS